MLQAHIVSPRGSLYYAGETAPYDFEAIRQHLRDTISDMCPADVRVEVILDADGVAPDVAAWLRTIAGFGVQVQVFLARAAGGEIRVSSSDAEAQKARRVEFALA